MAKRLCNSHGHDLYSAVKRKGMAHRITTTEQGMKDVRDRWLTGTTPEGEFDPLVVATLEVFNKADEMFGKSWEKKSGCPLCAVDGILKQEAAKTWVDNITDLMLVTCIANGLMPRAYTAAPVAT